MIHLRHKFYLETSRIKYQLCESFIVKHVTCKYLVYNTQNMFIIFIWSYKIKCFKN